MAWSTRFLPLVFAVSFIGVLLGVRGALFYRRYGTTPFRWPDWRDRSPAARLSRMLVVMLSAIVLLSAAVAFAPGWLSHVDPLYRDYGPGPLVAGAVLMLLGAILVWRAQADMREAWRVGIDSRESTRLVTGGLFQFCRNPIYLGLQLALFGLVGLVPGLLSLGLAGLSLVLFQVQARLEEAHLLSQHGQEYADYSRRVGRFLPWTGRLP